jgi:hypothetical protein
MDTTLEESPIVGRRGEREKWVEEKIISHGEMIGRAIAGMQHAHEVAGRTHEYLETLEGRFQGLWVDLEDRAAYMEKICKQTQEQGASFGRLQTQVEQLAEAMQETQRHSQETALRAANDSQDLRNQLTALIAGVQQGEEGRNRLLQEQSVAIGETKQLLLNVGGAVQGLGARVEQMENRQRSPPQWARGLEQRLLRLEGASAAAEKSSEPPSGPRTSREGNWRSRAPLQKF